MPRLPNRSPLYRDAWLRINPPSFWKWSLLYRLPLTDRGTLQGLSRRRKATGSSIGLEIAELWPAERKTLFLKIESKAPATIFFKHPGKEDVMRKTLLLLTTAALIAIPALAGPAVARDRSHRTQLSANQIADRADARTARMKVELRLTPEQEKNWSGFETAMRDMGKKGADRRIALREERAQRNGSVDAIEQMRKQADAQIERANDLKKLADAAQPLYASLDEQQKRRFAEGLFHVDRDRVTN
jgi:LTXXQ motif family protein